MIGGYKAPKRTRITPPPAGTSVREYVLWTLLDVAIQAAEHHVLASILARAPLAPRAVEVLGLAPTWPHTTAADVKRAYRRLALLVHRDRGGSDELFRKLVRLKDEALAAIEQEHQRRK